MMTTISCALPTTNLPAPAGKPEPKRKGTGNATLDALNAKMPDIPASLKRGVDTRTPAQRAAAVAAIKGGKGSRDKTASDGGNLRLPRNIEPAGREILKEQLKMKESKKADRLRALRENKEAAKKKSEPKLPPKRVAKAEPPLVPNDAARLSDLGMSLADLKKRTGKAGLYLWCDPEQAVYVTTESHVPPGENFDLVVMPPAVAMDKRRKAAEKVAKAPATNGKAAPAKKPTKPTKPAAEPQKKAREKKDDGAELRADGLRKGTAAALLVDTVCRKQGATHEELCAVVDWKQCLPAMLKACEKAKVTLRKEKKQGERVRYFGTHA